MKKIIFPIITLIFVACSGMFDTPEVADSFFKAASEDNYEKAGEFLSEEFLKNTSIEELKDFMQASALSNFKSSSWSSRKVDNNIATLEGEITTKDGGIIPLTMKFVKENKEWKILSIQKQDAGIVDNDVNANDIPDIPNLKEMIKRDVYKFALAVNKQDFTEFHNDVSPTWQKQMSAEELKEVFKVFIEKKIDLTIVKDMEPVIKGTPSTDKDGVLTVKGHFLDDIRIIEFTMSYYFENGGWMLFGTEIYVDRAPEA